MRSQECCSHIPKPQEGRLDLSSAFLIAKVLRKEHCFNPVCSVVGRRSINALGT